MDEVKRIIREIADTQVEIRVCERLKSKGIVTRGSKPVIELLGIYERKLITLDEQLTILKKPVGATAVPQTGQAKKPAGTKAAAPSACTKKPATVTTPTAAAKTNNAKKTTPVAAASPPVEVKKVAAAVATIAPQPLHQKRPTLVAVAVAAAPPIVQKRPVLVVTAAAATTARAVAQANNLKKPALVSAALVPPRPVRR
jgi:hypothetical protein